MHAEPGFFGWLAALPFSQAMRSSLWLYPIVEIVHIIGFATLVGSVLMFDLRLLGFAPQLPVRSLGGHLLPWSVASLALIVPAGLMMFAAHPQDFIGNPIFLLKLALIVTAGINATLFHRGVYRSVYAWNAGTAAPPGAKLHALASIVIWVAVICCGRLLAYT